jgi:hypothetical protein
MGTKYREPRIGFSDLPLFGARGVATLANEPSTYGGRDARAPMAALDFCGERHGGNAESEAAFDALVDSGALALQEARVLAEIGRSGAFGVTVKECAARMETHPNNISGRFTALNAKHEIRRKDADGHTLRRDGCAVWVLNGPRGMGRALTANFPGEHRAGGTFLTVLGVLAILSPWIVLAACAVVFWRQYGACCASY